MNPITPQEQQPADRRSKMNSRQPS